MNNRNMVNMSSDAGVVKVEPVIRERQESEENRSLNALSAGQSSTSVVEQGQSPVDDTGVSSLRPLCPPPICRQFWKSGNYDDQLSPKASNQSGKNYLHVHPMFLHSNATSHKWAFGAIAELLDNAVDEIQNGATFVIVDKISNPRDGSAALLIKDDGGGMDPQIMRHCMGFGFSDKKSKSAIGRYGNGFKTSTMRLGADAIVFSRHANNGRLTQCIGLLSYTFLSRTGYDRIVVPIIDYEFNTSTSRYELLQETQNFSSNLSILLQWSPYATEEELLEQFEDIGFHGTKVIIYNLWFNNDARLELDFSSDHEDIRIDGDIKAVPTTRGWKAVNEQHIANRLHYSLRVYLSILYLRVPQSFSIMLRGKVVEHHNIVDDLKYPQYILYKPQTAGFVEGKVVTTIGFLKEAPQVNIHGFCVYHKNRLILPYWSVVSYSDSRGRGVAGVLEANFIEPTHNKQDFERTSLLQKLENRLKEMTWEYWDFHCGLIGYLPKKKPRLSQHVISDCTPNSNTYESPPACIGTQTVAAPPGFQHSTARNSNDLVKGEVKSHPFSSGLFEQVLLGKRKPSSDSAESGNLNRQEDNRSIHVAVRQISSTKPVSASATRPQDNKAVGLIEENKILRAKCLEHERTSEELKMKALRLRAELGLVKRKQDRLLAELHALDAVKEEKSVDL